ncbi:unnamed protein product [Closterium sp. Naga37s-1]|nr:unnamed protein product [Closterium sp. Naga37s-1]
MALLLKVPLNLGASTFIPQVQQKRFVARNPALPLRASIRAEADRSSAREPVEVCETTKSTSLVVAETPDVVAASDSPRSLFAVAAQHCAILLAAGALVMSPALVADAAQGGGRVGGQSFQRSRAAPPPPRQRTQIRSNTNIYVAPPVTVAPPIYGGGFFAPSPFFGGWGWSPFTVVTPGPTVAIGVGGGGLGFFFDFFIFSIIAGVLFSIVRGLFRRDDDRY